MGIPKNQGGMGFRDLVSFNTALLAKQGWRLLKSPNSLAARILKAKYFPNGSFLKAKLGSKPSFAWRSIYDARDLLEAGLFWWIGNGKDVCIWGDSCIPQHSTYRIFSNPRDMDPNTKVEALINWERGWWNQELLDTLFTEEESFAINKIPIS
jgi:hypothetical protein